MITENERKTILNEVQALINKAILEHEKNRHGDIDIPDERLKKI